MPLPTRLVGPYDNIPTHQKLRLHFAVPATIIKQMFTDILPFRGSQDKVCARLFDTFYSELLHNHPNIASLQDNIREELINNLLNTYATRSDAPTTDRS